MADDTVFPADEQLNKTTMDAVEYRHFRGRFSGGDFGKQRLGQAFCNHFKLPPSKLSSTLWELDGRDASAEIDKNFEFI